MKICSRIISLMLIAVLLISTLSITALAVSGYYETAKANVPVWSEASSKSTKVKTIANKGTVVYITSSKINSSLNLWYKTSDGNWIYSENLTSHSHSYSGGICSKCSYEWQYSLSSLSGTYIVSSTDGAKIWSRPYSNNSSHIKTASYGTKISVVGKTTNQAGNIWYKTSDGYWVYSGNVKKDEHTHVATVCGSTKSSTCTVKDNTYHNIIIVYDEYCSCGQVVKQNVKNTTQEKHSYSGGICSKCNFEWEYSVKKMNETKYQVISTDGAKIWSRPYSNNSKHIKTLNKGAYLTIVAKTTNQADNLWYKTSDGYWVYSGNVAEATHFHELGYYGKVKSTSYEQNNATYHDVVETYDAFCYCDEIIKKNIKETSKEKHTYSGGICSKCNYEWKYSVEKLNETKYEVTSADGAKIWSRPYSNNSKHIKTLNKGAYLTIVAKTTNQADNLWYKTSDGYWVYSGNVKKASSNENSSIHEHIANATKKTSVDYEKSNKTYHNVISTYDVLCSCGSVIESGSKATEKEEHSYSGGICSKCDYEWQYSVSDLSGTYIVSNADGAKIWSRPYSNNSNHIKTLEKGTSISIVGKTTNQAGNVWYKTFDGYWVYSDNVTKNNHKHQAVSCGEIKSTTYTKKNSTYHTFTQIYDEYCSCGEIATTNKKLATDEKHSFSGDTCTVCSYTYETKITTINKTMYVVKNNAPVRKNYYDKNSEVIKTLNVDTAVKVVKSVKNAFGNTWYQTEDGFYIYGGNLTTTAPKKYTVKFEANGGTNVPGTITTTANTAPRVPSSPIPVRDGYYFVGWATSKSAKKADYQPGSGLPSGKNITLYALWEVKASQSDGQLLSKYALTFSGKTRKECVENGLSISNAAWCAMFVSACAQNLGYGDIIPYSTNTGDLHDAIIDAGGEEVSTPQPGDVVFWKGTWGRYAHTGIVCEATDTHIYIVHGNWHCSREVSCVCSPVNCKYCKSSVNYKDSEDIAVYVRPNWH